MPLGKGCIDLSTNSMILSTWKTLPTKRGSAAQTHILTKKIEKEKRNIIQGNQIFYGAFLLKRKKCWRSADFSQLL